MMRGHPVIVRWMGVRLAVLATVAGLIVAGCSGSSSVSSDDKAEDDKAGVLSDINPSDPSELRDGGDLRLGIPFIPANFNPLHKDAVAPGNIFMATLPRAFVYDAEGTPTVDRNYFTDIELTGTDPQQITYTINPDAVWSDGSPITWEDMRAQIELLQSENPAFELPERLKQGRLVEVIRKVEVERGIDDRQAVVTLARPHRAWQQFFGVLVPKSITTSVEAFNTVDGDSPIVNAGPFIVSDVDRERGRVVLRRNPRWWGPQPRLESITFIESNMDDWLPAIQNDELDAVNIQGIAAVTAARSVEGFEVRQAPSLHFNRLTLIGEPGSLLGDQRLRLAIAKAIDRDSVVSAAQKDGAVDPMPVSNHVYHPGAKGYRDNSGATAYDPAAANRILDELGWERNGDVRERDSRKLELRYRPLMPQETHVARTLRQNLAAIGIELHIITPPPSAIYGPTHRDDRPPPADDEFFRGSADIDIGEDPMAYTAATPADDAARYRELPESLINRLELHTTTEMNSETYPSRVVEILNEFDQNLWERAQSIPLFRPSDTHIVRSDLVNWGPHGVATPDFAKVGFLN